MCTEIVMHRDDTESWESELAAKRVVESVRQAQLANRLGVDHPDFPMAEARSKARWESAVSWHPETARRMVVLIYDHERKES